MKDYIFAVTDLAAFRVSLLAADSDIVNTDWDGVATIQSAVTMVKYNGNQSVAIARINDCELAEMSKIPELELVGQAAVDFIKSYDDVVWSNESLYYSIHDITTVTNTDEDGVEHSYTPPKLHCIFA